jgi:Transglutaminase-like enzymes, putative cysteine proteases
VYDHIQKIPVVSIPSAVDVLKTREGDCNEHTVLFTALARAAGIPAKMNVGIVYMNGRFYYHAWPAVYVGTWVDMDPTFGQTIADGTHIRLIEGDLNRQLDVIKLIGKIKLEVIEAR